MKLFLSIAIVGALLLQVNAAFARKAPGRHWVKGYTTKAGVNVAGHWAGHGPVLSDAPNGRSGKKKSDGVESSGGRTAGHGGTFAANIGGGGTMDGGGAPSAWTGPSIYTYPQAPTLEPSWVRQQRLERAAGIH